MKEEELANFLKSFGKDPSRIIFEDELTGIHNRRYLLDYLENKVDWDGEEDYPLSLIIIDLDSFDEVNEAHGHDTGDQVLTWMASLLNYVAGEQGLPIRFGSDEFVLLLPESDADSARAMADRVRRRTEDKPFRLPDDEASLAISVSIGIATSPEDGKTGKRLFQAADTALYQAKQLGKDRTISAGEIDLEKVFSKTALQQLKATGIVGREQELAAAFEDLGKFNRGNSPFLIFEGAPGMGKTALLETVRRNLTGDQTICVAKAVGDQQEGYRPYYLATHILVDLLNRREDSGAGPLQDLTEEELSYLAHLLPWLAKREAQPSSQDDATRREGIFATFAQFLPMVADYRPLVLLIDDLQFADEATLFLIRVLMQKQEFPLFVCGTALESVPLSGEEEAPPLDSFYAAHKKQLGIRKVKLQPLSRSDIAEYLATVFPNLKMPEGFEVKLARVTQGNPLFMVEIVHKLVEDGKVTLVGQEWVIEPLEEGYLPRSMDEIVLEKIAALNEDSRQLLEQAAMLGEDIPLSILTGASELGEYNVLDFLDRAESLGLVNLDYQLNDEISHFLGKQVLEISYGAIAKDRRKELHERIGNYKEQLYRQRFLLSASLLAYHFKRSANQEKARTYEQLHLDYSRAVFNAEEAEHYTGEAPVFEEIEEEFPLDPESLQIVPNLVRTLMTSIRSIQLYPPGSVAISRSMSQMREAVEEILDRDERLHLSHANQHLLANGEELEVASYHFAADSLRQLLERLALRGIVFEEGVTEEEVTTLLTSLSELRPDMIGQGFWENFAVEHELEHIELKQTRYSQFRAKKGAAAAEQVAGQGDELAPEEVAEIPKILRALMGAAKNIRLYPLGSDAVTNAIGEFDCSLQEILIGREALTIARMDQSLVVNGARVSTAEFQALASSFFELIDSVGLSSITFYSDVPESELETFIAYLGELPSAGRDKGFWQELGEQEGLTGLAFNQSQYALDVVHTLLGTGGPGRQGGELGGRPGGGLRDRYGGRPGRGLGHGDGPGAGGGPGEGPGFGPGRYQEPAHREGMGQGATVVPLHGRTRGAEGEAIWGSVAEAVEQVREDTTEELRKALLAHGKELLIKGEHEVVRQLLARLFENFPGQEPETREKTVQTCRTLRDSLILALQQKFNDLAADFLLAALANEDEPAVLGELATILYAMSGSSVQLGDYGTAVKILMELRAQQQGLEEIGDADDEEAPARVLDGTLDPTTQKLLEDDLKSGYLAVQEKASRVLATLGRAGIPLLVELIKQEKDLRVRQMAASILAELGPEAAAQIRRALVTEVTVEQRFNILEVIDTVTKDLHDELTFCLGDTNPKIRRGAFRLFERLRDEDLIEAIIPYATDVDAAVVKGTIRSLANLGSIAAVDAIISILERTHDPELAIACCHALGQTGDPTGIDALANTLGAKKLYFLGWRWGEQVRAAAAMALRQISHPEATRVLEPYKQDSSRMVRRLARSAPR